MRPLTVPAGLEPERLDIFLAHSVPAGSRRMAQRAIAAGAVRINGRRARKGQFVRGGEVVEVADELFSPAALQPNALLAVPVLYEDAAVIALDKPAGMPSHALRADETDTAANFLLARCPELAAVGKTDREAGLVHRLDTDTSGVLLAARTAAAYDHLRRQFATHQVTKEYLALVEGDVAAPGELRAAMTHDRNRRKMRVCSPRTAGARAAITAYHPLQRLANRTLLAVQIRTGVMHQIRVHLASAGYPIVGDRLYGSPSAAAAAPRHLLHACRVVFAHPQTGDLTEINSPTPADLTALVGAFSEDQRAFRGGPRKARQRFAKSLDEGS